MSPHRLIKTAPVLDAITRLRATLAVAWLPAVVGSLWSWAPTRLFSALLSILFFLYVADFLFASRRWPWNDTKARDGWSSKGIALFVAVALHGMDYLLLSDGPLRLGVGLALAMIIAELISLNGHHYAKTGRYIPGLGSALVVIIAVQNKLLPPDPEDPGPPPGLPERRKQPRPRKPPEAQ